MILDEQGRRHTVLNWEYQQMVIQRWQSNELPTPHKTLVLYQLLQIKEKTKGVWKYERKLISS